MVSAAPAAINPSAKVMPYRQPQHAAEISKAAARVGPELRLNVDGGCGEQSIRRSGAEDDHVDLAGLYARALPWPCAPPRRAIAARRLGGTGDVALTDSRALA